MARLTRRYFLKLAGSAVCVAAALPFANFSRVYAGECTPDEDMFPACERTRLENPLVAPPASLGRVATWGIQVYEQAKRQSKLVRVARQDDVLPLHGQVIGEAVTPYNATWYKTDDGYVHSMWVQPVENRLNATEPERAAEKFWGELTVPFSDSRGAADPKSWRYMRLYYTSVYRVVGAVMSKDGQPWYRLQDGITWSPGPYVPAAHIRRIDPAELTPLSPGASKRVEVDLKAQTITAYENNVPVLTSRVASGYGEFRTPTGTHHVLFKTPASRMTGGEGEGYYDLPGVPFPTYFTQTAVAIHGAYWHNDFGHPRSHGCLNVPAPVARWFWRWTEPSAPYDAVRYATPRGATGTVIKVA